MPTTTVAETLIASLRSRGVTLAALEGELAIKPASALTQADRVAIQANKAELLALLTAPARTLRDVARDFLAGEYPPQPAAALPPTDAEEAAFLRELIGRRKAWLFGEHYKWLAGDPAALSDTDFSDALAAVFELEDRLGGR